MLIQDVYEIVILLYLAKVIRIGQPERVHNKCWIIVMSRFYNKSSGYYQKEIMMKIAQSYFCVTNPHPPICFI